MDVRQQITINLLLRKIFLVRIILIKFRVDLKNKKQNQVMGIKGLNAFLKKYGKDVLLNNYHDTTIAIDTSIYMYKFKYKSTTSQFLKRFEHQINSFHRHNIKPIYIFDGTSPIEKKHVKEKRKLNQESNSIKITIEDIELLKEKLTENEIKYIVAPSEGEKLCSYLNKIGDVDVVMSNDIDSLLFGCKVLLTQSKTGYTEYKLQEILDDLQITLSDLIQIGIASGCDYNEKGVPGMGPSKSLTKLKNENNIKDWKDCPENIDRLIELFSDFGMEQQFKE